MKRLLSLLGAISMVATGSASVVSCDLLGGGTTDSGSGIESMFPAGIAIPEDQDSKDTDAINFVKGQVKTDIQLFDEINDAELKNPLGVDDVFSFTANPDGDTAYDVVVTAKLDATNSDWSVIIAKGDTLTVKPAGQEDNRSTDIMSLFKDGTSTTLSNVQTPDDAVKYVKGQLVDSTYEDYLNIKGDQVDGVISVEVKANQNIDDDTVNIAQGATVTFKTSGSIEPPNPTANLNEVFNNVRVISVKLKTDVTMDNITKLIKQQIVSAYTGILDSKENTMIEATDDTHYTVRVLKEFTSNNHQFNSGDAYTFEIKITGDLPPETAEFTLSIDGDVEYSYDPDPNNSTHKD
ncbi:hypothetical protein Zmor_009043 [Zophobas morio]|uniref:Lipoprotein n=1 Tax=Zophobas morio TaxID=2755281 RepID=A0AA38LYX8_9CUCU|nr:hypothetical protein Zmor_009043 [Zophobas morio]